MPKTDPVNITVPGRMIKLSILSRKLLLFFIALIPFSIMAWKTVNDDLGANPVEALTQSSGLWSLRFLLITLTLTPIRILFKQSGVIRYRRMLGLFTFFYSSIHLTVFIVLEHSLSWRYILEDITISPTVDTGLLAYLLLIPLALTSTNGMMRKLGKLWKKLHISVHAIALLCILHFALSEKADISNPLLYGLILLALLIIRGLFNNKKAASPPIKAGNLNVRNADVSRDKMVNIMLVILLIWVSIKALS